MVLMAAPVVRLPVLSHSAPSSSKSALSEPVTNILATSSELLSSWTVAFVSFSLPNGIKQVIFIFLFYHEGHKGKHKGTLNLIFPFVHSFLTPFVRLCG